MGIGYLPMPSACPGLKTLQNKQFYLLKPAHLTFRSFNRYEEFDSFDFSKEMNVMFTLKGETGELRFVKLRIFFSNLGFFVGVHSNNLERLNSLDEFVKGVVPKAK